MTWELTGDLDTFYATAGGFLRKRPIANTVLLTLIDSLRRRGLSAYGVEAPVFGSWRDRTGNVAGALIQTPPHPMMFSAVPPEAVPAAVTALAGRPLTGVNMPVEALDAFIAGWGRTAEVKMRTRLYRLAALMPPDKIKLARPARADDRDQLIEWTGAFCDEMGEPARREETAARVGDALAGDRIIVTDDGELTAMAVRTMPAAGVSRIGYVYTPPAQRRRGYAGAATAACAAACPSGEVVLFTDLANPTSNGLYQRLGFEPVEDRTVVTFA